MGRFGQLGGIVAPQRHPGGNVADFRVFDQIDQSKGEVAVNLDQVIRIERHEEDGRYRDSVTRVLSAIFVMADGSQVQTQIHAPFKDMADDELKGKFEGFVADLESSQSGQTRRRYGP